MSKRVPFGSSINRVKSLLDLNKKLFGEKEITKEEFELLKKVKRKTSREKN